MGSQYTFLTTEPSLHPELLLLKGPPWLTLHASFPAKLWYFLVSALPLLLVLRINLTEGSQQRPCDLDICSISHKRQGTDKTDGFLIEHNTSGSISSRIFMST